MRIAILSDIHDHIARLRAALARLSDADALLCCGDLCSPFMVEELAGGFGGPIHVVFGNNDGDTYRITAAASDHDHLRLWGELAELGPEGTDGTSVALHHFPVVGRRLAETGRYDLVCYGHTHEWETLEVGGCTAVNPGEIMGRFGVSTCAVYDTSDGSLEKREVRVA